MSHASELSRQSEYSTPYNMCQKFCPKWDIYLNCQNSQCTRHNRCKDSPMRHIFELSKQPVYVTQQVSTQLEMINDYIKTRRLKRTAESRAWQEPRTSWLFFSKVVYHNNKSRTKRTTGSSVVKSTDLLVKFSKIV